MQKTFTCACRLFVLIILGNTWVCIANDAGLLGCQCNIANACDPQGKPRDNWTQYLPQGVEQFGYAVGAGPNLAYACEDNTIAILFDRNSQIPLYSATVMTGEQLLAGSSGGRPTKHFRESKAILRKYQQKKDDYIRSRHRQLCVAVKGKTVRAVDQKWAKVRKAAGKQGKVDTCIPALLEAEIHKGHLVASNYGRGDKKRMLATFTYTNVVPQFGRFNSGPWQQCETKLVEWGKNNCAFKGAQNVQMFIVVGAVPSTVYGASEARWFGKAEWFSNYKDETNYPVNLPKHLWTAACCTYEYHDDQGTLLQEVKNTAFERINNPGDFPCNKWNIPSLSNVLSTNIQGNIKPFPNSPLCSSSDNYIALQC